MSEEGLSHLVYSKNVIEFVTVANEYCSYIENNASVTRFDFVDQLHKILPLLYLKTTVLPEIADENIEIPEKYLSEVDYNFLVGKISSKLAQFDGYQEVFDMGMQFSEEAIEVNISEDVCDIYQDLKDFVMAYRIGNEDIMTDALWECQNNFRNYWGQKLTNCMRALHNIRYGETDLNEDEAEPMNKEKINDSKSGWVSKHFESYNEEDN